jgi:phosphate transport system substrate-binding protein
MYKILALLISVFALFLSQCSKDKKSDGSSGRITVSGAWALYPMMVKWASEYKTVNPDVTIDVSAGGAGKGMADAISGIVDIGMVSREIKKEESDKGAWAISVAKDAVIPMMNANNPQREIILKRGMTKNDFYRLWISGKTKNWNDLFGGGKALPIHVFTRSDACGAAETWARYVGGFQEDLKGTGVYGDPGLADAVRNDELGIGYNNVNFAYDAATKKPVAGLIPVPLDSNGNGIIDQNENIYTDRDLLIKAISEGLYPSPPGRNLHLVCRGVPQKETVMKFLLWILSEGQRFIPETGYIGLPDEYLKKQAELLMKAKK